MNKVNNDATPHLKVLNQYIRDLSYENFHNNSFQNFNIKDHNTNIDIKVIYEPLDDDHFGVIIKSVINCETKRNKDNVFHLELDYFGFFKTEKVNSYNKDKLSSEGAKIIFPFARSIIANVTQNGGSIPIVLDNPDFSLLRP